MMKWEDIDEIATFQSTSEKQIKTSEEAKNQYQSLFKNPNVKYSMLVSPLLNFMNVN